jgi:superfamily I DNA/RNA helicase
VVELRQVVLMGRRALAEASGPKDVLDVILDRINYFEWVMEGRCGEGDEEQRLQNVSYLLERLVSLVDEKAVGGTQRSIREVSEDQHVGDIRMVVASPGEAVVDEIEGEVDEKSDVEGQREGCLPLLQLFLEEVALQTDEDVGETSEDRIGQVRLMTLHAAKGLEFPVVFITGCENGLLPMASWVRWRPRKRVGGISGRVLLLRGLVC